MKQYVGVHIDRCISNNIARSICIHEQGMHVLRCLDCLLHIYAIKICGVWRNVYLPSTETLDTMRYRAPIDVLEINTPISYINSTRSIIHAAKRQTTRSDKSVVRRPCVFLKTPLERNGLERRLIKVRHYRSIAQSSLRLKVCESGFGARGAIIRKWLVTMKHHRWSGTLVRATLKSRVQLRRKINDTLSYTRSKSIINT